MKKYTSIEMSLKYVRTGPIDRNIIDGLDMTRRLTNSGLVN